MILEKIHGQLNKDINQRIIYGLGLTLWTYLMLDSIADFPHNTSSLGVSYMTLYTGPAALLFLQVVRNNKVLWGLIFGLVTAYILVALYLIISDAIERSGSHVKAIDWKIKDVLFLLVFFGVLFTADWTIYKIRPKRLI